MAIVASGRPAGLKSSGVEGSVRDRDGLDAEIRHSRSSGLEYDVLRDAGDDASSPETGPG